MMSLKFLTVLLAVLGLASASNVSNQETSAAAGDRELTWFSYGRNTCSCPANSSSRGRGYRELTLFYKKCWWFFGDCGSKCDCVCNSGYVLKHGLCVPACSDGFVFEHGRCVPLCGDGFVFEHGRCVPVCGDGYVLENGRCVLPPCPIPSCVDPCATCSGTCVTKPGFFQSNGRQCPGCSLLDQCIPTCGDGYVLENGKCVPVPKPVCELHPIGGCDSCVCPPNSHVGSHVQCLDTLEDCFCNGTNDNADRNVCH